VFARQRGVREEAEFAEPVVQRNDHNAALGKIGTVIELDSGAAGHERAAIDPHHHRQLRGWHGVGRPHVQRKAVFALLQILGVLRQVLRTDRTEFGRIARTGPVRPRLRRAPAQVANRRRGKGDVLEDLHIVFGRAVQDALIDFDRDLGGIGFGRREQQQGRGKNKTAHGNLR